ncbi:hypothetical protein AVEN_221507-1 [Araneus ventricosus]|uniref:Uncharacterized protein n=1 Tax=Araneus ventricosus TaxID=182803 RepID=A0A4Y2E066_ARAVE|nr:hypothetical protein AVEN_221507-1 [Araneus ventricosus]
MDLIIWNRGQITKTTPEPAPPSSDFRTTPAGGRLTRDVRLNVDHAHIHSGFSIEPSFEPGILRPRNRNFIIRPPWSWKYCEKAEFLIEERNFHCEKRFHETKF